MPVPGIVDLHPRLQAGETLFGTFAGLGSPVATELIGRAGFDWVIIDLEHGAGTESDLLANLHALGATTTAALVRPQSGERLRIGRALDLGAHGMMVPRVDRPTRPARPSRSCATRPTGVVGSPCRPWRGPRRARPRRHPGDQPADPRDHPDRVTQRGGARPEIAAIDGVDVLFVGPADLSHGLGVPGSLRRCGLSRRHQTGRLGRRGRRQGGRDPAADAAAVSRHRELGFRFIGLGSDGAFISDGARAVLDAAGS